MDVSFEQKVREKAYEIWKAAGMADGTAHENWVSAEQAVMNETQKPVKTAAKKKPASAKAVAEKPASKKAPAKANAKTSTAKH